MRTNFNGHTSCKYLYDNLTVTGGSGYVERMWKEHCTVRNSVAGSRLRDVWLGEHAQRAASQQRVPGVQRLRACAPRRARGEMGTFSQCVFYLDPNARLSTLSLTDEAKSQDFADSETHALRLTLQDCGGTVLSGMCGLRG